MQTVNMFKATPITAEQYLQDQLGKHTKPDPVDVFPKHYEQQDKNMNTHNDQ